MDTDAIQLMRVAEELLKYLYLEGARKVEISYEFGPVRLKCLVEAKDLFLGEERLAELRGALKGPRQPELSEYYGDLVGKRAGAPELPLVSTMAEVELIWSKPEGETGILVSRLRSADEGRRGRWKSPFKREKGQFPKP